ncbi:MAG: hypothetical protein V3T70_05170 [Phycisphaerae bacterium]
MNSNDRTLIVGIDEAGYGPILGPLVVSAVAFELPTRIAEESLWDLLVDAVAPAPRRGDRRLVVADSKKLYRSALGFGGLERSALGLLTAWERLPDSFRDLLDMVCPDSAPQLDAYPWYRSADPRLPASARRDGIRLAAAVLRRSAAAVDSPPAGVWIEPLPEGHFNRLVNRTQNKSVVLLGQTLRLIQRIGDDHPNHPIHFFVDKQGGRAHYRSALMRAFEGCALRVVDEGPDVSRYRLRSEQADWRISFQAKGDVHHPLVAWASILSKYVRELFMQCFNAFWRLHEPSVAGTAGYYVDGQRFITEMNDCIRRLGIDRDMLIRTR